MGVDSWKGVHGSEGRKGAIGDGVDEHRGLSDARRIAGRGSWWIGKPDFVVLLNIQMAFQRVRQWSIAMVEITEIRAIDGGAGNDTGRDWRQHVTRV
jgi:hypothetical protein